MFNPLSMNYGSYKSNASKPVTKHLKFDYFPLSNYNEKYVEHVNIMTLIGIEKKTYLDQKTNTFLH